LVLLHFMF